MSDASFDTREQLARIDRLLLESQNMQAETRKFIAEHDKLAAEARKFERDRTMAPWQIAVVSVGGIAGLIAAIITALKAMGVI